MHPLGSRFTSLAAVLAVSAVTGCAASSPPKMPVPATSATPGDTDSRIPPATAGAAVADCDDATATAADSDDESADEPTTLDDGFEPAAPGSVASVGKALPFAELTDAAIAARIRDDIGALGSMAIGRTNGGALVAGVRMPDGANWEVVHPSLAWGTRETVDGLAHAIDAVATRFPNTPKLFVGDISVKGGGHLHPHVSHQSGRDVDLGYYLTEGHRWYADARGTNLDRARTWHLIRTLIADSDIELILVDLKIQRVLKDYARDIGEDSSWLDEIFQVGGKSQRPIVMHAKGHATHLHIRFYNPVAQELGRRAYRTLVARRLVAPPTLYVTHTVKPGETLSHLAVRYKVTADAIKKANALKTDVVRIEKTYKIPRTAGVAIAAPVVIPARRSPPAVDVAASARSTSRGVPCGRLSSR